MRPFQDVLLDLGARLGLPGMTAEDGSPRYPGGYSDYIVNHERKPGVGSLMGWRGQGGDKKGVGEPNPEQLKRYIENGCFWQDEIPDEATFFKHANQAYLDYATDMGFIDKPEPIIIPALQRSSSEVQAGRGWPQCPAAAGDPSRARRHVLRPSAVLVSAF